MAAAKKQDDRRRAKGDGQLYERSLGVWRLRVLLGTDPKTDRSRQVERVHRGNRTSALAALRKPVNDTPVISPRTAPNAPLRVEGFLEDWLAHLESRRKASIFETFRFLVKNHLVPALGKRRLTEVTPRDIHQYYDAKLRAGLKPMTVRLHAAALSSAFNLAVDWEQVGRNLLARSNRPTLPSPWRRLPHGACALLGAP